MVSLYRGEGASPLHQRGKNFTCTGIKLSNDLIGLCSSSLTTRVISRKRIALIRGARPLVDQLLWRGALVSNRPARSSSVASTPMLPLVPESARRAPTPVPAE